MQSIPAAMATRTTTPTMAGNFTRTPIIPDITLTAIGEDTGVVETVMIMPITIMVVFGVMETGTGMTIIEGQ